MKKVAIVATHMFSGSGGLLQVLADNPRVQCHRTDRQYGHPAHLEVLTDLPHKCPTQAAVYVDEVTMNYQIASPRILDVCRFIYVIRPPKPVLEGIVRFGKLQPGPAARHYCYRLRRLAEMARRTPGALLYTWDDLAQCRGLSLAEEYLNLKEPLKRVPKVYLDGMGHSDVVSREAFQTCERAYEKYLFAMRTFLRHPVD